MIVYAFWIKYFGGNMIHNHIDLPVNGDNYVVADFLKNLK